jgi:hypothetical protein
MKKCIFRIWTVIGGLLLAAAVSAQKNLSDYSIVDNCTPEAVGFEASLTPLFDKSDLTIFQLPQLQGIEEIILKANRPYVLKGFSVVSADDEQQDHGGGVLGEAARTGGAGRKERSDHHGWPDTAENSFSNGC